MKKNLGFTLAEVLITLGIIGVVAAFTLPTLIHAYQEKVIVHSLTEVYSILNQAYKLSTEDNGPISAWNLSSNQDEARAQIIDKLTPYLKTYLICDNKNTKCKDTQMPVDMNGKNTNVAYTYNLILGNTTKINIDNTGSQTPAISKQDCDDGCYIGAFGNSQMLSAHLIMVNITGKDNKPMWGKDLFLFAILDRGIIPYGVVGWHKKSDCNPSKFSGAGWWNGTTCAGYVLNHKNLDYLKCTRGFKAYCTGNYNP